MDLKHWYQKIEPLGSILREQFQQYYLPGTKDAIDEMVVRFCGRSRHRLKIRNKPIKEGYKIFALCDHGYTYGFLSYSSTQGTVELSSSAVLSSTTRTPGLTPTSNRVLHLAKLLPSNFRWNVILDNYFTNVPLFEQLLALGIGAARTTWVNSAGFPSSLRIEKQEANKVLPWSHISREVVGNICCLIWQDNSSVLFMTSYHDIRKKVDRLHRRPKITSSNATVVHSVFQEESRKVLPIPECIDDYNYNMGVVDIADQLSSYYSTQQPSQRNWLPLFYWLLDTSLVNAYRIQGMMNPHQRLRSEHFHFRSDVADELILYGIHLTEQATSPISSSPLSSLSIPLPRELKVLYISRSNTSANRFPPKKSKPTLVAFPPRSAHSLEQRPTRLLCILCRWQRSQVLLILEAIKVKSVNLGCCECNVTLCRDIFFLFHDIHPVPHHQATSNYHKYFHSWVLNEEKA